MVEGGSVAGLVIGDAVLPAAPQDADPFEGEAAEDGLVAFAGAFLPEVIGLGPGTLGDGLAGPLDEGLAEELGRVPAPVDPELPAAAFGHRGGGGVEEVVVAGHLQSLLVERLGVEACCITSPVSA